MYNSQECLEFKNNPLINPKTNRTIKKQGPTYNKIKKICDELNSSSVEPGFLSHRLKKTKASFTELRQELDDAILPDFLALMTYKNNKVELDDGTILSVIKNTKNALVERSSFNYFEIINWFLKNKVTPHFAQILSLIVNTRENQSYIITENCSQLKGVLSDSECSLFLFQGLYTFSCLHRRNFCFSNIASENITYMHDTRNPTSQRKLTYFKYDVSGFNFYIKNLYKTLIFNGVDEIIVRTAESNQVWNTYLESNILSFLTFISNLDNISVLHRESLNELIENKPWVIDNITPIEISEYLLINLFEKTMTVQTKILEHYNATSSNLILSWPSPPIATAMMSPTLRGRSPPIATARMSPALRRSSSLDQIQQRSPSPPRSFTRQGSLNVSKTREFLSTQNNANVSDIFLSAISTPQNYTNIFTNNNMNVSYIIEAIDTDSRALHNSILFFKMPINNTMVYKICIGSKGFVLREFNKAKDQTIIYQN